MKNSSHRMPITLSPTVYAALEGERELQGVSISALVNNAVATHPTYRARIAQLKEQLLEQQEQTKERTTLASPQIAARYYTQLSPENKHKVDALLHRLGATLEPRMYGKVEHEAITHNGSKLLLGQLVAALTNVPDIYGNDAYGWRQMLGITDETAQRVTPAPAQGRLETEEEMEARLAKPYDLNWGEEATEKVVTVNGEEIDLDDLSFEE